MAEKPAAKPAATDASGHPWVAELSAALPGAVVAAKEFARQVTVTVAREKIREVARHLKDVQDFKYCVDVTAVDWRDRQPRFDVVYHFYSFTKNDRIRVKLGCAEGEDVPSIAAIFLAANWSEREVWDLFGPAAHRDVGRVPRTSAPQGLPGRGDRHRRGDLPGRVARGRRPGPRRPEPESLVVKTTSR